MHIPDMYVSAREGNLKNLEILLQMGVSPDLRDGEGNTSLIIAAPSHIDIIRRLLEAGADVNAKNNYGVTALMQAANWGNIVVIDELLKYGANVDDIEHTSGMSALLFAASTGYSTVINVLLQHGARTNFSIQARKNALVRSFISNKVNSVKNVLELSQPLSNEERILILESVSTNHSPTTIIEAVLQNNLKSVSHLLTQGVYVDEPNPIGVTALMVASGKGLNEMITALLNSGALVDSHDRRGFSPLMYASSGGDEQTVRLLIQAGSDINENTSIITPLMLAVSNYNQSVSIELLRNGADPNMRIDSGVTPLMLAIGGPLDIVRALLEAGAKVDYVDITGKSVWENVNLLHTHAHYQEEIKTLLQQFNTIPHI